jgi:hypothetical protein
MPGPFDTTAKHLVDTYPLHWLKYLGLADVDTVDVVDADLSTVVAEADKIIRVGAPAPWLVHLEFQASYDRSMGRRLARYNLLLCHRHDLDVLSVLVLLRPEADGPATRGHWCSTPPGGQSRLDFRYPVVRIWTEPVERLLNGPLGLLPLAPLADLTGTELPNVIRALERRIDAEATSAEAQVLEVVTFTLLGLRYPPGLARQLMPGVRNMRESTTYQAILEEGRAEGRAEGQTVGQAVGQVAGRKAALLQLGERRFGPPEPPVRTRLEALNDLEEIARLTDRLLDAGSWDELLIDR